MARQIAVALCALPFLALPAAADAIDGDWCFDDGRSLTIDGPQIRTPTGDELTGEYSRHAFRYVGAAGSEEEAHDVLMQLWSDDELRINRIVDGEDEPQEIWHRCKPIA
jgi:hypothetical protein